MTSIKSYFIYIRLVCHYFLKQSIVFVITSLFYVYSYIKSIFIFKCLWIEIVVFLVVTNTFFMIYDYGLTGLQTTQSP